jgi:hypothetical protein
MDFPVSRPQRTVINSMSDAALGSTHFAILTSPASAVWPGAANSAQFVPFTVTEPFPVTKLFWLNGVTVVGNVDAGVYTLSGTRLFSTGGVSAGAAQVPQSFTLPSRQMLSPGSYYMGLAVTSITHTLYRIFPTSWAAQADLTGMKQATDAYPLPDTVTFVAPLPFIPIIGIANGWISA